MRSFQIIKLLIIALLFCSGCQKITLSSGDCNDRYEIGETEYNIILQLKTPLSEQQANSLTIDAIDNDRQYVMEYLINNHSYKKELDIKAYNNHIYKQSVLSYACEKGRTDIVQMLLSAREKFDQDSGCFLMVLAAEAGDLKLAQILYEAGAPLDCEVVPALFQCNGKALTEFFLEHGLDVNYQEENGDTFLHYEDSVVDAEVLVAHGARLLKNEHGYTALHCAAFNQDEPMVKYLISIGADANLKTNDGTNALHLFFTYNTYNNVFYLESKGSIYGLFKTLLDEIEDKNACDNKGRNYLHYAAAISDIDQYVAKLIEAGVDVNHKDNNGQLPAHIAAENGNIEYIQLLVNGGADLTIKDINGKTPLDIIIKKYPFLY